MKRRLGKQRAALFGTLVLSTNSANRCHAATHMTPILRPQNWQPENHDNSPEGHGDRVGNVMAMMMMSQALDRDEWHGEREERCQEFCIQMKTQSQQMQQQ